MKKIVFTILVMISVLCLFSQDNISRPKLRATQVLLADQYFVYRGDTIDFDLLTPMLFSPDTVSANFHEYTLPGDLYIKVFVGEFASLIIPSLGVMDSAYTSKADSLIVFVTPTQLSDSISEVRIDSVWFENDRVYIRQGDFLDSTGVIQTFTTDDEIDPIYAADSSLILSTLREVVTMPDSTTEKDLLIKTLNDYGRETVVTGIEVDAGDNITTTGNINADTSKVDVGIFNENAGNYRIAVSDANGKLVWTKPSDFDADSLGSGAAGSNMVLTADGSGNSSWSVIAAGINVKLPVRCSTIGDSDTTGLDIVNGYQLIAGDRVLVTEQTSPEHNGIFVADAGAWTRATDADTWAELYQAYVAVQFGDSLSGSSYYCTIPSVGSFGDPVTWSLFSFPSAQSQEQTTVKTGVEVLSAGTHVINFDYEYPTNDFVVLAEGRSGNNKVEVYVTAQTVAGFTVIVPIDCTVNWVAAKTSISGIESPLTNTYTDSEINTLLGAKADTSVVIPDLRELFDSIATHTDSLQSHNVRLMNVEDSLTNIYTESQVDNLLGTKADTSTVLPTIRTAVTQATETTTDNSLLKTVGTSGREVEQTGVTIDDANIVSAPTFSATNLTDGYIPYHISDALGFANSGLSWDGIDKLSLNSTQIVRMPDQTTFAGSLIVGNGGNNLTYTTGEHGKYNTFVGLSAGYSNTTGNSNVFTGYAAGYSNTTGSVNVFTGNLAGYSNTTGYRNVFTGYEAGRYIADGSTPNQTSNNSVFIGSDTRALSAGNTNQIVIGSGATGKGSNTVVLGNTSIVGTYLQGNVGISCNSPTSKLSVLGTTATNLNLFNYVNADINKLRTTFADATDTSSTHLSYTSTGSPEFHIVGKGGSTLFKVDSVSATFLGTYSGIYVADASTAQSIPTGTTYTKSTAFTTNGSSSNCTADAANDKITITKTGHYLVNCPVSFSGESPNVNWKMAAFLGGVEQPQVHVQRKIGTGGDVGSTTCTGIINVTSVPVDVDIRFRHDQAGDENVTVVYSNLTVTYIGE